MNIEIQILDDEVDLEKEKANKLQGQIAQLNEKRVNDHPTIHLARESLYFAKSQHSGLVSSLETKIPRFRHGLSSQRVAR